MQASKQVAINNSYITTATSSEEENAGKGGNLVIEAADIVLADQTLIVAGTKSTGQAGSVKLDASKQVAINNSTITMQTVSQATNAGKGGGLVIEAADIVLADGTDIDASTLSAGQGGSIVLDATDQIRINGAETVVSSASHSPGTAGNCLLYTSPSPRDGLLSRMPSSA